MSPSSPCRPSGTVPWRSPTKDAHGQVGQQLLDRDEEAMLRAAPRSSRPTFDGDGAAFRLAAEALRIRMAGQHDAMLAVTTSDLESLSSHNPLPARPLRGRRRTSGGARRRWSRSPLSARPRSGWRAQVPMSSSVNARLRGQRGRSGRAAGGGTGCPPATRRGRSGRRGGGRWRPRRPARSGGRWGRGRASRPGGWPSR